MDVEEITGFFDCEEGAGVLFHITSLARITLFEAVVKRYS